MKWYDLEVYFEVYNQYFDFPETGICFILILFKNFP